MTGTVTDRWTAGSSLQDHVCQEFPIPIVGEEGRYYLCTRNVSDAGRAATRGAWTARHTFLEQIL